MLNPSLPYFIICGTSLVIFIYKLMRGTTSKILFLYYVLFSLYIASLVSLTFFPFPYQKKLIELMIEDNLGTIHNLIPFKTIIVTLELGLTSFIKQIIGNVILFIPLGFILPILFSFYQLRKVTYIGFLVSLSIELIQFVLDLIVGYNYRSFDVDDIITNTLGTLIGVIIYKYSKNLLDKYNLTLH
ncbi:VanZ family protein [Bacillus xiamenensis]|uniref:VanZ family protein n=1 Tax=Bacillus xiamenensis TaxID=1178537 RepID=A0ABT4EWW0_9BACI|nr:VanZ family protein [Bacillus xiamenensis]MCY9574294.1 VanZ family protein [Bacillus xiamenensis]